MTVEPSSSNREWPPGIRDERPPTARQAPPAPGPRARSRRRWRLSDVLSATLAIQLVAAIAITADLSTRRGVGKRTAAAPAHAEPTPASTVADRSTPAGDAASGPARAQTQTPDGPRPKHPPMAAPAPAASSAPRLADRRDDDRQVARAEPGGNESQIAETDELRKLLAAKQQLHDLQERGRRAYEAGNLKRAAQLLERGVRMRDRAGTKDQHRRLAVMLAKVRADQHQRAGREAETSGALTAAARSYEQATQTAAHAEAQAGLERVQKTMRRQELIGKARAALGRGENALTIDLVEQAIKLGAGLEVSDLLGGAKREQLRARARTHLEQNRLDDAADAYEKLLRTVPDDREASEAMTKIRVQQDHTRHLNMGDELSKLGRYDEAKREYRQARQIMDSPQTAERLEDAQVADLLDKARKALAAGNLRTARALVKTAARAPGAQRHGHRIRQIVDHIDEQP
jgi:tetratricopeptide (TPR) repeat protein